MTPEAERKNGGSDPGDAANLRAIGVTPEKPDTFLSWFEGGETAAVRAFFALPRCFQLMTCAT